VAGKVFGAIKPKEIYIILGPNHTGRGQAFSLDTSASWQTPLGDVGVDIALAQKILASGRYVKSDHEAHAFEHSIEVQLPFLQFVNKNFKFVPIIASDAQIPVYRDVGRQIAQAVTDLKIGPKVTIIASSDMTHYEPHEAAKKKDRIAIEAMLELDEEKLYQRVREFDISMCGYAPACIMIAAAKALGAKSARLVGYETSAEASGDYSSVVGYAGVLVS
jgi:AmmeMemoRadiSam system protein B